MKIKAGNDERVWLFFRNIILIGGLLLILCPLWMVLINSFKTLEEAGKNFFALPSKLNLENYIELFTNSNYWIFLKNSFKITVISIILILIFVPSVSYSIARNFLYYDGVICSVAGSIVACNQNDVKVKYA